MYSSVARLKRISLDSATMMSIAAPLSYVRNVGHCYYVYYAVSVENKNLLLVDDAATEDEALSLNTLELLRMNIL